MNIATKELFPIVLVAALWSPKWRGKQVLFRTNNEAVVAALASYSARDPPLVHFLRCLFFIEAHFDFKHKVVHIPWEENGIADALLRNDMSIFSSLLSQAAPLPSAIPQSLIELLSDWSLLWTSPRWRGLLRSLLREVSQQEQ